MNPDQFLCSAILEQSADAIIYADREGIIRLWNLSAERLFGFEAGQALGQSLDLIIPERGCVRCTGPATTRPSQRARPSMPASRR